MTVIPCELCGAAATAGVTWGMYSEFAAGRPHRKANLCEKCLESLWSASKAPVAAGLMHFACDAPEATPG